MPVIWQKDSRIDGLLSSRGRVVLVEERRQRVLDLVKTRGFVSLDDLAGAIGVSDSTIRRDLEALDQAGALRKTHGGAVFVGNGNGLPALEERSSAQLEE